VHGAQAERLGGDGDRLASLRSSSRRHWGSPGRMARRS
jgi:hypothetical protein